MMSYLLLILASHTLLGSTQPEQRKKCSPEITTAECGTRVDLLCTPTSLSGQRLKDMHVEFDRDGMDCMVGVGGKISRNGRWQCFLSESKAGLLLYSSKNTDAGAYTFFINTGNSNYKYDAHLEIIGSKKAPNISLMLNNMTVVCKVDGGCPVGRIEWSDNYRTNWTNSATVKEEDGLIVSTLHLSASSIMEMYYCTVRYQLMKKIETNISNISMESLTKSNDPKRIKSGSPEDTETVNKLQILVPIFFFACLIIVVAFILRRRRKRHGQRQALVPVDVNDTEMQKLREENGLQ